MQRGRFVTCMLASLLPWAVAGLEAQTGETAVLEGMVYDSTDQRGLSDARVVLWNTEFSTVSEDEGQFRLEGIPPGEYTVAFFHRRLGVLGISSGTRRVNLEPDDREEILLAIPSRFTILLAGCPRNQRGVGPRGKIVGRVEDSSTGVGLPESTVTLTWNPSYPAPGRLRTREVRADADGWWRLCSVPEESPVGVSARFLNRQSHRRELVLPSGGVARLDLQVGSWNPSVITGRLKDVDTSDPVEGAEVSLQGTRLRAVTDAAGRFQFRDVDPGQYTLDVNHLAYGTRKEALQVESGMGHQVEVDLARQPIDLPPISVTVSAMIPQTEIAMGGQTITRAELDQVRDRSHSVSDLFRFVRVSGLHVRKEGGILTCLEFMVGQTRMNKRACEYPQIFIDGVHTTDPAAVLDMPPDIVERIQIFRPVEAGPLFGLGSGQGVVMIWTRSGTSN